jgi:hypothetical protein
MKLLRNLAFAVLAAKVVLFSGLFCGEFSELGIEEKKSATAPLSCSIPVKTCELWGNSLTDSMFMLCRPCQELNQLFIILLTNKGTQYSWWDVSHLITNSHVVSLTAGFAEEKKSGFISRRATQDLSKHWKEPEAEQNSTLHSGLSIAIPTDSDVSRNRGRSIDWYIGHSPTSPSTCPLKAQY